MSDAKPRIFTSAELRQFDGLEGRPLFIVFKGKVYDLSSSKLWINGKHLGQHTRDQNLTEAIKGAPHGEDNVHRFVSVGELTAEPSAQVSVSPVVVERKVVTPRVPAPVQTGPGDMARRSFLKLAAAAGGAVTVAAVAATIKAAVFVPEAATVSEWPKVVVTNIKNLTNAVPTRFNYPLTNTPNILVKLGEAAENGVGPDSDIVAFSSVCQHLGCIYGFVPMGGSPVCNPAYRAAAPLGYCCCHGSQFDFQQGAKVLGGPAARPVPQVKLEFDSASGDISAVAMGAPTIFGHGPPGTSDPALVMQYDLQGGEVVTQATIGTVFG